MKTINNELYHALDVTRREAEREVVYWQMQSGKKPLFGWSREKHEAYCLKQTEQARAASAFCFIRMMQIDPD